MSLHLLLMDRGVERRATTGAMRLEGGVSKEESRKGEEQGRHSMIVNVNVEKRDCVWTRGMCFVK